MAIRVLIVDDHGIVRQGLRMYLGADPELEVVGEARDGAEAIDQARALHPQVVLMDLLMPVMDGITATAAIRREMPDVEVLALTSVLEDASVVEAVRAGATGYLLKDTDMQELCRAIKAAAAGQVQLAPAAAERLMAAVNAPMLGVDQLTARERDVLRLVALGQSNAEIAACLTIGEQTVKTHVSHILAKLNLPSRTQAALYAMRLGIVRPNIAQEALNNAVKHAQATEIRLRLEDCGDGLELEVRDNGSGFDPAQAFPGHLGLRSMRERALAQGGSLEIDSAPGRGTRVRAIVPAHPAGKR